MIPTNFESPLMLKTASLTGELIKKVSKEKSIADTTTMALESKSLGILLFISKDIKTWSKFLSCSLRTLSAAILYVSMHLVDEKPPGSWTYITQADLASMVGTTSVSLRGWVNRIYDAGGGFSEQ